MPKGYPKKQVETLSNEEAQEVIDKGDAVIPEEAIIKEETGNLEKKDYNEDSAEYKMNVIEDYYGAIDTLHLDREDPKYKYRYLNSNETNLAIKTSNVLADKGGWQLCPRKHLIENLGIDPRRISPDGLYRAGSDLILAFMPKELYQKKVAIKDKRAAERMGGIDQRLKDGDPSTEAKHGGLKTARQLGLK